jgi:hypothetical protein
MSVRKCPVRKCPVRKCPVRKSLSPDFLYSWVFGYGKQESEGIFTAGSVCTIADFLICLWEEAVEEEAEEVAKEEEKVAESEETPKESLRIVVQKVFSSLKSMHHKLETYSCFYKSLNTR